MKPNYKNWVPKSLIVGMASSHDGVPCGTERLMLQGSALLLGRK